MYIDVKSVLFVYFRYKVCVQIVTWIYWRGCRNNYGRLGPTLAASFEDLARCDNVACLFYIILEDVHLNWLNCFISIILEKVHLNWLNCFLFIILEAYLLF